MVVMEDSFLEAAISEARQGMREGGIPIGSVIVHGGKIIGRGHNRRVQQASAIHQPSAVNTTSPFFSKVAARPCDTR